MKVKVLNNDVMLPLYATKKSAGADVRAKVSSPVTVKPNKSAIIPTGLKVAIPDGYEIQIRPRSGLAAKNMVTVLNTPGTIDGDFRGEIGVILINHGSEDYIVNNGERIGQFVLAKVEQIEWDVVESLDDTERGSGGFGSTGTK